jgi:hypothetical protein
MIGEGNDPEMNGERKRKPRTDPMFTVLITIILLVGAAGVIWAPDEDRMKGGQFEPDAKVAPADSTRMESALSGP